MRKIFFFSGLAGLFLILNSCGNGADSLPELSGMLVNALKANNVSKLAKAIPSEEGMVQVMKDYFSDQYHNEEELDQKSKERADSNKMVLSRDMNDVIAKGKDFGIDWPHTKMTNFNYTDTDTKDGYRQAKVYVNLQGSNAGQHKIVYDAVQYEKRWYIYGHMKWE